MGLQPPDPGGSSYSSAKPSVHNGQWTLWARRAQKKYLVSKSPAAAVPGSSFLGVAPLKYDSILSISVMGGLGIVLGVHGKGKEVPRHGVFFWPIPLESTNQEHNCILDACCPNNLNGASKSAVAL